MGNIDPMDVISDVGSMMSFGILNIKKGRINVPFSGAMIGDFLKGTSNLYTGEQLRGSVNDTFSTSLAKGLETVAGAVAGVVATAGMGAALSAPATGAEVAAEGGMTAAEGGIAASAAAPTVAGEAAADAATPLASGVMSSTTPADMAGALLTGPVGAPAASSATPAVATLGETAGSVTGSQVPSLASGFNPETMAANTSSMIHGAGASELATKLPSLETAPSAKDWFSNLSPGAQLALVTGGLDVGRMGTGTIGGMFQGVSTKKQLELDTLINEQRQNQVGYLNTNQTYAPRLNFRPPKPSGMIPKAGKV